MNKRNYDDLKYSDEIMFSIKSDRATPSWSASPAIPSSSSFNSLFSNKMIDMPKMRVHPNNKFYYNVCPFHKNNSEYYEFFVDERVHLFYCLGCGSRGNAFDFLMDVYNLDINNVTEILGVISDKFDISILNEKQMKIYNVLIKDYCNYKELLKKSEEKTLYLTNRVKNYLELHQLTEQANYDDIKKISDRLCCSTDFVNDIYHESVDYKKFERQKIKQLRLKERKMEFN